MGPLCEQAGRIPLLTVDLQSQINRLQDLPNITEGSSAWYEIRAYTELQGAQRLTLAEAVARLKALAIPPEFHAEAQRALHTLVGDNWNLINTGVDIAKLEAELRSNLPPNGNGTAHGNVWIVETLVDLYWAST